jgi:ParB family transcriptional regulator, chromosome partitioning protein
MRDERKPRHTFRRFFVHPSSLIPHPSSLIPHPSSLGFIRVALALKTPAGISLGNGECSMWNIEKDLTVLGGLASQGGYTMDAKPRLGRGLSSLLGAAPSGTDGAMEVGGRQAQVRLEQIQANPYQARKVFDEDEINHLSESIRNHGILQPLVVRASGDSFQLIAGERRLRAATAAGLAEVPVTIVNFDDQQVFEASLVENIQRTDLNPIEKAQGFKDYLDRFGSTQEQLAARLGMERSTLTNLVNLLSLPPEIQEALRLNQISLGHAKLLKGISSQKRQVELCKEVVMKGHSVKALELAIKQQKAVADAKAAQKELEEALPVASHRTAHVQSIETELRQRLATRVEIRINEKDKGSIMISFDTNDEFERLIESLRK